MGTNEKRLEKVQAGFESSHGVGVAATRILLADVMGSYDKALATLPVKDGTYKGRKKGRGVYGRENVGFTLTDQFSYEDGPWHLEMAVDGGVTAVADVGTPIAYTREYIGAASTDTLKSATYEHGEPSNVYESHQVFTNSWTIRGDSDSDDEPSWMFEAEQIGLDWVPSSYTPALTILDTEPIIMRGTKVYLDDEADPFGTTQLLNHLISFSITGNINRHLKAFAENEFGYAVGKTGRADWTVDAQVVLEFDNDDEFALYRQSVPVFRKLRLEREGSIIHGAVHKRARIDIGGYWQSVDPKGDREGNKTITLGLAAYDDQDEGFDARFEIVNDLLTLA